MSSDTEGEKKREQAEGTEKVEIRRLQKSAKPGTVIQAPPVPPIPEEPPRKEQPKRKGQ